MDATEHRISLLHTILIFLSQTWAGKPKYIRLIKQNESSLAYFISLLPLAFWILLHSVIEQCDFMNKAIEEE